MQQLKIFGVDLAKTSFYVVALNAGQKAVQKKKLSRAKVLPYFAKQERACIAMEACASSHYWARELEKLGHQVVLLPPQHVKAYLRGQKNDYNDAQAIAEACQQGRVRPVQIKTVKQQDKQSVLRMRSLLSKERVSLINQLRGLLGEYGIAINQGPAALKQALPEIVSEDDPRLSSRMKGWVSRQYQHLVYLEEELLWYEQQLKAQVKEDETCQLLMSVPGFGPINSTVFSNWLGDGQQFSRGRDTSAALGVVPRQHSTGGKQVLGRITKRGDKEVRTLVIHGARAAALRAKGKTDPLSLWIQRIIARRGFNKAVVALANKLVRIAWAVVVTKEPYRPVVE